MNYNLFWITETSGWFCQHQFSSAKEEAWKVKEEGDQLEQMLIKNRSGCCMAFLFGLPSSVFFSKGNNDWGQKLSGNACYFYESDYIYRLFWFSSSIMCVFHKINSKNSPKRPGQDSGEKGSLPAEVGTGKECLLGERQCQTARRTFEVATAKGTPSLVETHPAWSWWAESRIKIVELWKSLVLSYIVFYNIYSYTSVSSVRKWIIFTMTRKTVSD